MPILFIPKLRVSFPEILFEEADPNENFVPEDGSIIIDTVKGITEVTWFDSLEVFEQINSISPHDYDLGFHLRLLQKLHKISDISILGVPCFSRLRDGSDYLKDIVKKIRKKLLLYDNPQS